MGQVSVAMWQKMSLTSFEAETSSPIQRFPPSALLAMRRARVVPFISCNYAVANPKLRFQVALTWILYYLCVYPEVQAKLRKEILKAKEELELRGDTMFSADDYAKMPYLDAVIVSLFNFPSITACTGAEGLIHP
jgi:hypothetical protein